MLDEQPSALFLLDTAGVIRQVGGAWEQVTETRPEDVIGTPLSALLRLPTASHPEGLLAADGQTTAASLMTRTGQRRVSASWRSNGAVTAGHLEPFGSGYLNHSAQQAQTAVQALEQAVFCLGTTLDTERGNHVERMMQLATRLAEVLALGPEEVRAVRWGAALHDVGKSRVPADILNKPAALSREEYAVVKHHPQWGLGIVQPLEFLSDGVRDTVLHHHERVDGQGYPHGLRGEAIPLSARIVAVADVFDALTSVRPYKDAWTPQAAAEYLIAGAGTQFDAWLVRVFVLDVLGFTYLKNRFPAQ